MRALLVLVLFGCPSEEPDVPCGDPVAIGTGTSSFEALDDGGDLTFVQGNQGGYHLPLAARVCTIDDPGLVEITATVEATGEIVSNVTAEPSRWLADGDCCHVMLDVIGFLYPEPSDTGYSYYYEPFDPESIDGEVLVLALAVTDGAGERHEATVRVTAHRP
jgi:hypothetical protein